MRHRKIIWACRYCFQMVKNFTRWQETFYVLFLMGKDLKCCTRCISTDMFSGAGSHGWEIEDSQSTGVRHRAECRYGGVVSCSNEQQHLSLWNISTAERGEWALNAPILLADGFKRIVGKCNLIGSWTYRCILFGVSSQLLGFVQYT